MVSRRDLLKGGAAIALAGAATSATASQSAARQWESRYSGTDIEALPPGTDYHRVITPDGTTLPYRVVDGVKVFHLMAEEVEHEFTPGLKATCWGYNGQVHGPTMEAVEGDRVRVYVTNRLPADTSVHWHGVFLPNGMDGVAGLTQRAIRPGETFVYEWTFRQHGTFMYHSHHDEMTQMALGMMGMIVVHPRNPTPDEIVDRDFALLSSTWKIEPGTSRPDPNAMGDFNVLTFNARAFPGTSPLVVRRGQRVRIRLGNLSAMDHHPIHLHGHFFKVVATDGGAIPVAGQWPEGTILVPTGSTRTIEFVADAAGDWALHCHMTHHVMNQMGHGIPNLIGIAPRELDRQVRRAVPGYMTMGHHGMGDHGAHLEMGHMRIPENSIPMVGLRGPFDYITMGGMVTTVKVRDDITSYEDPGWYQHPDGTVASPATEAQKRRDGIA